MTKPAIGFIGLGVMGTPMARHLAAAGYRLTVLDLDPTLGDALAAEFADVSAARRLAEVGAASDIVVTMLPSGAPVQQTAIGPGGLIESLKPGSLVLDTSSSEPWFTRETAQRLAEAGIAMVDAPVSGAEWGAIAAELVFMVGGAKDDVARVVPLFDIMGKAQFHLGPVGAGHIMKSLNNLITSVTFMATGEALLAGKHAGLDPDIMIDVLNQSTGGSWVAKTHFKQRIFNRSFDDPFKLALMVKDIGIALEAAERTGVPIPLSQETGRQWREIAEGQAADASVSRMIAGMEERAGIELTPGSS
ncbi:NAD(P)-dependent oxidoreductase [Sphingobium nicotianae]|uniref:NAD(P)-dependent oxidoreductase n=1 Tax=Sphingobium nicotianae TaxID=2782607 RepID=A0A9X1IRN4_9SPHN|nr:NAD(P)-dependent oxidoreductase [Sphingobium nicotianae]